MTTTSYTTPIIWIEETEDFRCSAAEIAERNDAWSVICQGEDLIDGRWEGFVSLLGDGLTREEAQKKADKFNAQHGCG